MCGLSVSGQSSNVNLYRLCFDHMLGNSIAVLGSINDLNVHESECSWKEMTNALA